MNSEFEPTLTQQPKVAPPPPPAQRTRSLPSLFWPGFVAGFFLLSVLSCGGLVFATGLNRIDLEDIQGTGVVWTPPAVQPTATPDLSAPRRPRLPEAPLAWALQCAMSPTAVSISVRALVIWASRLMISSGRWS